MEPKKRSRVAVVRYHGAGQRGGGAGGRGAKAEKRGAKAENQNRVLVSHLTTEASYSRQAQRSSFPGGPYFSACSMIVYANIVSRVVEAVQTTGRSICVPSVASPNITPGTQVLTSCGLKFARFSPLEPSKPCTVPATPQVRLEHPTGAAGAVWPYVQSTTEKLLAKISK